MEILSDLGQKCSHRFGDTRKAKTRQNNRKMEDIGEEANNIVRVFFVKTLLAEGRRRFHKNTAYAGLGFRV